MLNEHTLDQLRSLRLDGMVRAQSRSKLRAPRRPHWASTSA